jgi:hypothetical protein
MRSAMGGSGRPPNRSRRLWAAGQWDGRTPGREALDPGRGGGLAILGEADRFELIQGEIVEMPPMGLRSRAFVGNLTQLLAPPA